MELPACSDEYEKLVFRLNTPRSGLGGFSSFSTIFLRFVICISIDLDILSSPVFANSVLETFRLGSPLTVREFHESLLSPTTLPFHFCVSGNYLCIMF